MKKIVILGLIVGLTTTLTYVCESPLKAITNENIKSPSLECRVTKNLVDKDNKKIKLINAIIFQQDNNLNISIKNSCNSSNDQGLNVASDEKVFAVIKDRLNKRPEQKVFFDQIKNNQFQKSIDMPYFYDMIYLDFYKQKKSDPDFTINDKNFIGRTKICMRNITAFYLPGQIFPIIDVVGSGKTDMYIRALPNFYRVDIKNSSSNHITKIVLPDNQKNLMSDTDKVNSVETVNIIYSNKTSNAYYTSFYIPKDITQFSFLVYEDEITDDKTDIISKYDVKLDRK